LDKKQAEVQINTSPSFVHFMSFVQRKYKISNTGEKSESSVEILYIKLQNPTAYTYINFLVSVI
jgi:hypothetical protein